MTKPTVLVVDDELFFRRLYSEILSEDDYQVEAVASGEEALARLRQGGVDLVLSDMIMPGIDGLEVLRQVRSMGNPPDMILATGHATLDTAIQALKNGARDYLIKPFNPEELRHLARTCLEQRRLLDENTLLKSQIQLFQKGQTLASLLEVDRLLAQAVATLIQEAGGARGFAFLKGRNKIEKVSALNDVEEAPARALATQFAPLATEVTGMRVLRGNDLPSAKGWPEDVRTVCVFPLRCQRDLKGAILVFNPVGSDFTSEVPLENLLFLGEQAGIGFDNAFRYQGARELIYTDDLTGLFNQRYLEIILDQEVRRSERYGLEFSVIFLDLDLFKQVNDTYGHIAGSNALKEVAGILRNCLREVDIPFRYGGDEFTALLVETGVDGAAVVADRIRQAIEGHVFLSDSGQETRITASVGYATFPHHAKDKKTVLDLADQAMYYGKKVRNVTRGAGELKSS